MTLQISLAVFAPLREKTKPILAAFTLCDRNYLVNRGHIEVLDAAISPGDFKFIDLCRCAQSEMQREVVLRTINRSTQNILSLPYTARC
jgi:hypothetical protein